MSVPTHHKWLEDWWTVDISNSPLFSSDIYRIMEMGRGKIWKHRNFMDWELSKNQNSENIFNYEEFSQLSSTYALGPKLEQHTQIPWKAKLKCDMHTKVGRWRWGWHYRFFSIHVLLISPTSYDKDTPNFCCWNKQYYV